MALLFDIIPEMDGTGEDRFITPESLAHYTAYEDDIAAAVRKVSESLEMVLQEIGCPDGIKKIRNIRLTLVIQQEVLNRLLETYTEVHRLFKRMEQLLASGMFDEENQKVIRERVEAIVEETLLQAQREVFFKIVNAKEVAEGEKNIDGPALLFPGIEKLKNQIIQQIEKQNRELGPVALSLCKTFQGIADSYIEAEEIVNDRERYDSIYQTFSQERDLRKRFIQEISPSRLEDAAYIALLVDAFEELKEVYRQKTDSLKHIVDPLSMDRYRVKFEILERGGRQVDERLKPLQVLKRMADDFPRLVKQLDFFADSHYQARAVFRVLEEIREEMNQVFRGYNLDSFTVVSFLKYKLNGISHMYESIHYYYAAIQMREDMEQALTNRYRQEAEKDADQVVRFRMAETGLPAMIQEMHDGVARMNQENFRIHQAFLEYRAKRDLALLKSSLTDKTQMINALFKRLKETYRGAQRIFADFLMEDLGATDLDSQLNGYLRKNGDLPEAPLINKGIKALLSTRRKTLAAVQKQVAEQFSEDLDMEKVSAIALLKVRKDFMHELLAEIQQYPAAQEIFLQLLKEFIKLRDDAEKQQLNDQSILWMVNHIAGEALDRYSPHHQDPSERNLAIDFLSGNITPQEIESFSRLLPVLPRNELHLDTSFGRLLLDVIRQYQETIRSRGGSATHLVERIYEKRERSRLIGNICTMLQSVAEPFFNKIWREEKKSNHLIRLQRIKYRKELGEVIRYWQYLIREQIEPGQGQRGRFRRYSPDEQKLMMKYISPEQLELIDRQLAAGLDLEADEKLQAVERFLMEIVAGLFRLFGQDERIRSEFETFFSNRKFQRSGLLAETEGDLLSGHHFMPNIRSRLQTRGPQSTGNRGTL